MRMARREIIETQQTLKCRDNKDDGVEKEDVARGERALAKRERAANRLMAVRSCEKICSCDVLTSVVRNI